MPGGQLFHHCTSVTKKTGRSLYVGLAGVVRYPGCQARLRASCRCDGKDARKRAWAQSKAVVASCNCGCKVRNAPAGRMANSLYGNPGPDLLRSSLRGLRVLSGRKDAEKRPPATCPNVEKTRFSTQKSLRPLFPTPAKPSIISRFGQTSNVSGGSSLQPENQY